MIKLANSGVDESVLMAYATNSVHTFNLNAEQIIYLNDLGVPGAVVTAMIQRDEELKTAAAANAAVAAPAPPPQAATTGGGYPPPETTAPPPDYSTPAVEAPLTPPPPVSQAGFYDSLAPYGAWVNINGYGQCWQPTVAVLNPGWQPYFDGGHWVYTDYGWYWLSDYSWGWAPFHYGRWFCDARFGWCWAPDTVWGPSWVAWRYDNDYCGWAPLPPGCTFSFGFGLLFHGRHVRDFDDFGLGRNHYRFVAWHDFEHRHLHDRALRADHVARIFDHTRVVTRFGHRNHVAVNEGISVARVRAATHTPVHRVALHEVRAGRGFTGRAERYNPERGSLTIYHPTFSQRTPTGPSHLLRSPIPPRPVRTVQTTPVRPAVSLPTRPARSLEVSRGGTVLSYRGPNRNEDPTPWQHDRWPSQPPAARAPLQSPAQQHTLTRTYPAPTQRAWTETPHYNYWQRNSYPPQRNYARPESQSRETVTRSYQAPAQRTPFQAPHYSYTPPQRSYSPAPSRAETYRPAPSRPAFSQTPHYSAPQNGGGGNHPAPSRPQNGGSHRR